MILDRHSLRPLKSLTASMYTSNISTSPDHAGSLEFVVIVVTTMLTGQKTGVARGPKQHVRSTPSAQTGGQFSGREAGQRVQGAPRLARLQKCVDCAMKEKDPIYQSMRTGSGTRSGAAGLRCRGYGARATHQGWSSAVRVKW